jgi:hypothetical protein
MDVVDEVNCRYCSDGLGRHACHGSYEAVSEIPARDGKFHWLPGTFRNRKGPWRARRKAWLWRILLASALVRLGFTRSRVADGLPRSVKIRRSGARLL